MEELRQLQKLSNPEWAMDCPQRIREHAFADAVEAVANAKKKCIKGQGYQRVSFRSKKKPRQGFGFDKKSIKDNFVFSKLKDRCRFFATEESRPGMEGTRITLENGRWFLLLPQKRPVLKPENQRLPLVALDPGVRTFMSIYSPYMYGKLGEGDFQRIYRQCRNLDRMLSERSKATGRRRGRLKKAIWRMRWKIRDLVDELHHKIAYFLVTRFDVILLPTFETSQMVSKLRSKTARAMLTWGHFRFKQFLKSKAKEYSATVEDVCEAYTSKTCSYCGKRQNIGSKKVMRCGCGVSVDRDLNGARGIMLRALEDNPTLTDVSAF